VNKEKDVFKQISNVISEVMEHNQKAIDELKKMSETLSRGKDEVSK
jgi:uncharacterized protein YaaN involved in tellurite resistance